MDLRPHGKRAVRHHGRRPRKETRLERGVIQVRRQGPRQTGRLRALHIGGHRAEPDPARLGNGALGQADSYFSRNSSRSCRIGSREASIQGSCRQRKSPASFSYRVVFTITGIRVQHPGISVQDARNRCSASVGIGVQLQLETVFSMGRNAHFAGLLGFPPVPCLAFSKKLENHAAMVALYFMYYNFGRVHQTLRVTPAMEAGIAGHVWSIDEIVALLEK
jgi:hypothetical protein